MMHSTHSDSDSPTELEVVSGKAEEVGVEGAQAVSSGQEQPGENTVPSSDAADVAEALRCFSGLHGDGMAGFILRMSLAIAIPVRIFEILDRGGIEEGDIARIKGYAQVLREHGADLFVQSQEPGGTGERFNQVSDLIAVLSFLLPGGVQAFGGHWDAQNYRLTWEMSRGVG